MATEQNYCDGSCKMSRVIIAWVVVLPGKTVVAVHFAPPCRRGSMVEVEVEVPGQPGVPLLIQSRPTRRSFRSNSVVTWGRKPTRAGCRRTSRHDLGGHSALECPHERCILKRVWPDGRG